MAHKTFFGKLFGWIGDIFHDAAEKLWNDLTPEEQASLKHGSGVVQIINTHLQEVPEVVVAAIQAQYPDLDIAQLEQALLNVCKALGIKAPSVNIHGAITAIQMWLQDKTDNKVWEWASSALAELITVAINPGTIFQKVSVLIEWVYEKFIKK